MKCDEIKYQLPDFVRGKVSDVERATILEHLGSCQSCAADEELFRTVQQRIEKEIEWMPDKQYWVNLLPQIHSRIENKNPSPIFSWLIKFALPAAAAIAFIFVTLEYLPVTLDNSKIFQSEIAQLPESELQDYAEQQSVVGLLETKMQFNGTTSVTEDKIILKQLVKEEKHPTSIIDDDALIDNINDEYAEKIVSIIEKKSI